jgi:hypothetical protein
LDLLLDALGDRPQPQRSGQVDDGLHQRTLLTRRGDIVDDDLSIFITSTAASRR